MNTKATTKKVEEVVKNDATLKVVETPKTTEVEKKADVLETPKNKAEEEIKYIFNPSAVDRLKKAEQLNLLGQKFSFLKTKEDELSNFVLSSDGTGEKIELTNKNGFKFVVSNTKTINAVVKLLQDDLKNFVAVAEKEINEFVI